jgi:hypothetical protein
MNGNEPNKFGFYELVKTLHWKTLVVALVLALAIE